MPCRRQQSQRTGGGRLRGRMTVMPWEQAAASEKLLPPFTLSELSSGGLPEGGGSPEPRCFSSQYSEKKRERERERERVFMSIPGVSLRVASVLLRVAWLMLRLDRCLPLLGACHCLSKSQGYGDGDTSVNLSACELSSLCQHVWASQIQPLMPA